MGPAEQDEHQRRRRERPANRAESEPLDPVDGIEAVGWLAGIVVFLLCWFLDWPNVWTRMIALVLPPLAALVAVGLNVYLALAAGEPHRRPWLIGAIAVPGYGLFFAVTSDHTFLDGYWQDACVFVMGLVTVIAGIAIFARRREPSKLAVRTWLAALALAGILGYADAAVKQLDVWLDTSTPRLYRPTVLGKRYEYRRRRGIDYYVTLSAWGPNETSGEMSVSEAFYDRAENGVRLCATVRDGYFALRYYRIDFCS